MRIEQFSSVDEGVYKCEAANQHGALSSSALLALARDSKDRRYLLAPGKNRARRLIVGTFVQIIIAAKLQAERSYIAVLLFFLQFKEFELYWGAVFLRLE